MSLYEIDALLQDSIKVIKKSQLEAARKRQLIWNLERLPERHEMDAGGFTKTETGTDVVVVTPAPLGLAVVEEAHQQKKANLIYDWSAFFLNYGLEYFEEDTRDLAAFKRKYMEPIKAIYKQHNFDDYEPTHASLTIYEDISEEMLDWFSPEQVALIEWFLE